MDICHAHNRRAGLSPESGPWGLRLRLPEGDTFSGILGEDWETVEWFPSERARARRIRELESQFVYYRKGDRATLSWETIDPPAETERD
jgi:hypothetical protein